MVQCGARYVIHQQVIPEPLHQTDRTQHRLIGMAEDPLRTLDGLPRRFGLDDMEVFGQPTQEREGMHHVDVSLLPFQGLPGISVIDDDDEAFIDGEDAASHLDGLQDAVLTTVVPSWAPRLVASGFPSSGGSVGTRPYPPGTSLRLQSSRA